MSVLSFEVKRGMLLYCEQAHDPARRQRGQKRSEYTRSPEHQPPHKSNGPKELAEATISLCLS